MRALLVLTCLTGAAGIAAAFAGLSAWFVLPVALVPVAVMLVLLVTLHRDTALLIAHVGQFAESGPPPVRSHLLSSVDDALERRAREVVDQMTAIRRRHQADSLILDRLPDPVIVLDANRGVRRFNNAARLSFGEDLPAVLRHPALRSAIDRALTEAGNQDVELSLSVPVPREMRATLIPLDPAATEEGRVAVILSDRSRDKAVERMRADFVANVSHELRTPLTSLVGFTETLRGPAADDPPAREQFLKIMAEQGARMSRLIDDLLSLSRIELVEHQPPTEAVDLPRLTTQVLTFYTPRLAERRARIATEIGAALPAVRGDSDQLVQVLQNLLDNALKYGREGGTIRLTLRRTQGTGSAVTTKPASAAPVGTMPAGAAPPEATPPEPGGDWARPGVVVAVADDGIGIPAEHLPRLTERFYRVDRARSRSAGGTGLGLAIVKHIVNRHRGQLRIESIEGVGTTVSVWLPLAPGTAGPAEATAMAGQPVATAPAGPARAVLSPATAGTGQPDAPGVP
jgi:two-component system phosphate regulon sensor histidine kinase PhoR